MGNPSWDSHMGMGIPRGEAANEGRSHPGLRAVWGAQHPGYVGPMGPYINPPFGYVGPMGPYIYPLFGYVGPMGPYINPPFG